MPRINSAFVLTTVIALLTVPATGTATHGGAHAYEQTDKHWPPEPTSQEHFGASLAADGDLLAIGPDPIQIYQRTNTEWTHTATLEAPAEPFADREHRWGTPDGRCFGDDLALDATTGVLAIGDPCLDVPGNVTHHERDAGAVYIYQQQPNASWTLVERFLGPINGDWNDQGFSPGLGASLAVEQGTVVAGAPWAIVDGTPLRGIAEIYEREDANTWTRTHRLTSPFPAAEQWDQFGFAVAAANGRIAVGAPSENATLGSGAGAVHVYQHDDASLTHEQRLTAPLADAENQTTAAPISMAEVATGASFGEALAFDGDGSTLVVGSSWGNRLAGLGLPTSTDFDTPVPFVSVDAVLTNPWGVAYVFDHAEEGFSHTASLENPDREAYSRFAQDLAVNDAGDTVVVGAYGANQSETTPASPTGPTEHTLLPASDRGLATHHPSTGAAYVFERSGDWACSAQLAGDDTDSSGAYGDDFFGTAVDLTGSTVWTGAPRNGDQTQGTAYAFEPTEPALGLPTLNGQARCGPR